MQANAQREDRSTAPATTFDRHNNASQTRYPGLFSRHHPIGYPETPILWHSNVSTDRIDAASTIEPALAGPAEAVAYADLTKPNQRPDLNLWRPYPAFGGRRAPTRSGPGDPRFCAR